MAKGLVTRSSLEDIADAIRVLNGKSDTYTPAEMDEAIINAIPTETASGNPISITDAANYPVQECVTSLEPIQDLHGYDKPWPAGGGKNLLPMTAESQTINDVKFTVNNDGTISVQGTATANIYFYMFNGTPLVSNSYIFTVGEITVTNGTGGIYASTENNQKGTNLASGVVSGAVNISNQIGCVWVYLQSGATISGTIKPMIRLSTVSDATFAPYSNICPITGHTGVELTRTGKNLLDTSNTVPLNNRGVTVTILDDGGIRISGTPSGGNERISIPTFFVSPGVYTLSVSGLNNVLRWISTGEPISSGLGYKSSYTDFTQTYVVNMGVSFKYLYIDVSENTTVDMTVYAQFELGSTATVYEPYTSEAHSVTFPQGQSPVYGCEVDWINGVLRVTEANIASYNGETLPSTWISDRDVYAEGTTPSIGAQVVYKLATPLEITLTPEVITLLKGENNVWTDSGESEIEYKVDLQSYINKLINAQNNVSANLLSANRGTESVEPLLKEEETSKDDSMI